MQIEYCEGCGYLIPEDDMSIQRYGRDIDGRIFCYKCATAKSIKLVNDRRSTGKHVIIGPRTPAQGVSKRGPSGQSGKQAPVEARPPAAPKKSIPWLPIVGIGAPLLIVVSAIALVISTPTPPVVHASSGGKVSTSAPPVETPVPPSATKTANSESAGTETPPPSRGGLFGDMIATRGKNDMETATQADKATGEWNTLKAGLEKEAPAAQYQKLAGFARSYAEFKEGRQAKEMAEKISAKALAAVPQTGSAEERLKTSLQFAEQYPSTEAARGLLLKAAPLAFNESAENEHKLASEWEHATDLIAQINPERHASSGSWRKYGGILSADGTVTFQRIGTSSNSPHEEYDLRAVFIKKPSNNMTTGIYFGQGETRGGFLVGAYDNKIGGICDINGKSTHEGPCKFERSDMLKPDEWNTSVVEVRKDRVTCFLNGKKVCEWKPEKGKLTSRDVHSLRNGQSIGFLAFTPTQLCLFQMIEFPKPGLRKGMWGSFYQGDSNNVFKELVVSRPFKDLNHDYKWEAPTPGMQSDNFGVRIEGVWKIPQDGSYEFEILGDDYITLTIDGTTQNGKWPNKTTFKVDLKAGEHPFRMEHREGMGGALHSVKYRTGTDAFVEIPDEWFYYDPNTIKK